MIHVKKFLDKVSLSESRKVKDIVLPIDEARGLRDEVSKLLSDLYEVNNKTKEEIIKVEIKGGSFK